MGGEGRGEWWLRPEELLKSRWPFRDEDDAILNDAADGVRVGWLDCPRLFGIVRFALCQIYGSIARLDAFQLCTV